MRLFIAGILSVCLSVCLCFSYLQQSSHRQRKTSDPLPYTLFPLLFPPVLITLLLSHSPHYFSACPVLDKLPTCLTSIIAIFLSQPSRCVFLTASPCPPLSFLQCWTVLMRRNSTERRKLEESKMLRMQRVNTGHEGTETVSVMRNNVEQHYSRIV